MSFFYIQKVTFVTGDTRAHIEPLWHIKWKMPFCCIDCAIIMTGDCGTIFATFAHNQKLCILFYSYIFPFISLLREHIL